MHIKAIITAQEVLVRDPMDDDVVSVVEELRRRLPIKVSGQGQGEEESCAEDSEENGRQAYTFGLNVIESASGYIPSLLYNSQNETFEEAQPVIETLKHKGVLAIGAASFCWGVEANGDGQ
ncbi:hypothetical protein P8452_06971 [Trifolium repens]|nr:hypothetical protein P8452_06971 [Trifolium repens]